MAVCIRNIGQVGRNAILIFMMCILAGCAKDFSNTTEMSMKYKKEFILDERTEEAETNVYDVMACQAPTGETYPQIVLKGSKDIVCGADFLNNLLKNTYCSEYQIFYADDKVLSVCFWRDTENGRIPETLTLNFQCINYRAFHNGSSVLLSVQDDNDYSDAPWSGNGITLSFDKLLQEFEQGNYYLDEEAYTFRQSQPLLFMESVQRQFQEIEERGFLEAYYARFFGKGSVGAYRMYLKEGRVGFFVSSAERWDALEAGTASYETMPYDFRIEIAYDWKADTLMYQVPYEVYRKEWENGEFSYLQVNGTGESEEKLNTAILEDLLENLQYLDVEKTNSIMRDYRDTAYWRELPKIGPPRVTWQSERYLCIRQEPLLDEATVLRFAEEWKRYHVYDLETGESLKLGDIINLNQSFVQWLREEKKVEAWTEYHEGGTHGELGEIFDAILEVYSEEQLLSVLEDAEFWLKEEAIYFRLPFLNEYGKPLYSYGGTGWPDYLVYAECRISKDDLKGFLTEYHAAEDTVQDMPQMERGAVEVYRVPYEELDCDFKEGDYLAIEDTQSGSLLYIPDCYGEIVDVSVNERSIAICDIDLISQQLEWCTIPIVFSPDEMENVFQMSERNERVLSDAHEEELPVFIWNEEFVWENEVYEIKFERISAIYRGLFWENGELLADYAIQVTNEKGSLISEQILTNFPVTYEEMYWLIDFSSDGFPDLAFCTEYILARNSSTKTDFFIWDAETSSYQQKAFHLSAEYSEWIWMFRPLWNEELSTVLFFVDSGINGNVTMHMYAYSDNEWEMVRKLEPVYRESGDGASEESACIGQQETFYENGEPAGGRLLELKDSSAVWFDENSVWCKDNAENVQLYPGEEWQEITVYINQVEWKKYVRCQENHN